MRKSTMLLLLSSFIFTTTCKNKTTIENTENNQQIGDDYCDELSYLIDTNNLDILALNNDAVKLLQQSQRNDYDSILKDSLLDEALQYLNLAIKKDSNFHNAYLNKSAVLRELNKYNESIQTLQQLLNRKKFPEAIFNLGLLYEKAGKQDLAYEKYKEALKEYEELLKTPLATKRDELNRDYVFLFLNGKEEILNNINEEIKKDPDNTSLLIDKSLIEEFDRQEFIESF